MYDDTFVLIIGRLARDPELQYLQNGTALCKFAMAVNDRPKKDAPKDAEKKVHFFECVAWSALAEAIAEHVHKGDGMVARGNLQQEKWTSRDGNRRERVTIVVRETTFMPQRPKGNQTSGAQDAEGTWGDGGGGRPASPDRKQPRSEPPGKPGGMDIKDEECPF
jgi:single-strand DNA-binding protein